MYLLVILCILKMGDFDIKVYKVTNTTYFFVVLNILHFVKAKIKALFWFKKKQEMPLTRQFV